MPSPDSKTPPASAGPAGPSDVDADQAARRIRVTFRRPSRIWRWTFWRTVRRVFVVRAVPLREVLFVHEVTGRLRELRGGKFDDADAVAAIVGIDALYLSRPALRAIWDAYAELNLQQPATAGKEVSIGRIMRRLERDPYNLTREEILELTPLQIEKRLAEFGEDELERMKAEAGMNAGASFNGS